MFGRHCNTLPDQVRKTRISCQDAGFIPKPRTAAEVTQVLDRIDENVLQPVRNARPGADM
jgi:hypothetical protein